MSVALGLALGVGIVLLLSVRWWPRTRRRRDPDLGRVRRVLDDAGLWRVSTGAFALASVLAAAAAGASVLAVTGIPALAALAVLVAGCGPAVFVRSRARALSRARRGAWPDVIDHLVAAVRAGVALPDAVSALAETGPVSLRPAFAEFAGGYASSGRFGPAADQLKRRLADPVADRIIETLRMARDVGGSELTTVLRSLARTIRADSATRAELEARQGWTAGAARLGVAAPWVVLVLLCTRPEAAAAYASPEGTVLILAGGVLTLAAYRLMLAVGRLPEEQRWFR